MLASGLGSRITGVGLAQLDALKSNIWIACLMNMNALASCIKDEKTCLQKRKRVERCRCLYGEKGIHRREGVSDAHLNTALLKVILESEGRCD